MKYSIFSIIVLFFSIIMQAQPTHEFQKILASDGQADDMFGNALSIQGNIAVFGTPQDDDINNNAGAAYIYQRSGASWNFIQKLTFAGSEAADMFGEAVDIDGDYIVVAAYQATGAGSNTGAVYVYKKNGSSWNFQTKIYAGDGESADNFGKSVAISGDYIVVGADNEDYGSGSAYVFHRSGDTWSQVAKLEGSDEAMDYFGHSVDIDGDYIVIGAWQSNALGSNTGSAYVFHNNGGVWEFETQLIADDAAVDDALGYSVAISGNHIVAGAHGVDLSTGAAYVFYNNDGTWEQQAKLTENNGSHEDYFGKNVSVSGDYILVAAERYDETKSEEGAVYLFIRDGTNWVRTSQFSASDANDTGLFGYCTAIDGDYVFVSSVQGNGTIYAFGPDNVSVNQIKNTDISVFPNPAKLYIQIDNGKLKVKNVEVSDMSGKIVLVQDKNNLINISTLISGIYFLKIKTEIGTFYKKIIKK